MSIVKPTIGDAVASIARGIKKLDSVITVADRAIEFADSTISVMANKKADAALERDRANRIKAKLEELIS